MRMKTSAGIQEGYKCEVETQTFNQPVAMEWEVLKPHLRLIPL